MSTRSLNHRLFLASAMLLASTAPALAAPAVTAQATASATGLDMDGEGSASTHIVKIADVSLSTAGSSGLTVSITSGYLTKADASTPVAFQVVLVGDGAAAPSSSAFTTPSGTTYILATGGAGTVDKDLYIKYTPVSLQDPGSYSASVGLSVVDN